MNNHKLTAYYLLMLAAHVAHIFEEIWGKFWIISRIGLGWYLSINWLLFCIPTALFYFTLKNRRWAYKLSIVYAAFMVMQGLGHYIATIASGNYFGGFAGGFTGLGLIIIGVPLIFYLSKQLSN